MNNEELVAKFGPSVQIPTFGEFVMEFVREHFPSFHLTMEEFEKGRAPQLRKQLWHLYTHKYNKELVRRHIAWMQVMAKAAGILEDEGEK